MYYPRRSTGAPLAAIVLLFPVFSAPRAAPAETIVDSRIDRVTVYSDCARVTRVARVHLDLGIHVLVFERLPLPPMENALACRVDDAGRLLAIRLAARDYDGPTDAWRDTLESVMVAMEREDDDLDAQTKALDRKMEFLSSVQKEAPSAVAENAGDPQASPLPRLRGLLDFLVGEWSALERERLRIEYAKSRLDYLQACRSADLSELTLCEDQRLNEARIELEVLRTGALGLELSYLVSDAEWRLVYDASLDRAAGRVEWTSRGEIRQWSGEDWNDVEITLAASDADRPTAPPALDPIPLPAAELPEPKTGKERAHTTGLPALPLTIGPSGPGASGPESFLRMAHRETVPADQNWHQAAIATCTMQVTLEVLTVPRMARRAYLAARGTNQTSGPLLPGNVRLYDGGDFLGAATIDRLIAPGAPVTLGFGSFDRVEVGHELVAEKRTETRRTVELCYHYRTRIMNYDTAAHDVVVLDQIPVSTDERIEVKLIAVSPPAVSAPDPRGTLRWEEELPAGGEQVIDLEYEVRYPKEWQLAGSWPPR